MLDICLTRPRKELCLQGTVFAIAIQPNMLNFFVQFGYCLCSSETLTMHPPKVVFFATLQANHINGATVAALHRYIRLLPEFWLPQTTQCLPALHARDASDSRTSRWSSSSKFSHTSESLASSNSASPHLNFASYASPSSSKTYPSIPTKLHVIF